MISYESLASDHTDDRQIITDTATIIGVSRTDVGRAASLLTPEGLPWMQHMTGLIQHPIVTTKEQAAYDRAHPSPQNYGRTTDS
jgi:hypothetical protein